MVEAFNNFFIMVMTLAMVSVTSSIQSQHCTGSPLIQVEIVSTCKSHYMHWLASQSSFSLTSLILECKVVVPLLSPVWVQVQVHLQVQEHFLRISSLPSENIESETEEVSDFVGWTRLGENFSTELCQTKFLSSL